MTVKTNDIPFNIAFDDLLKIAIKAGRIILDIYNTGFTITNKEDDSPLTLADKLSHSYIQSEIRRIYPELPVISEEGKSIPYSNRSKWETFWLIDPLDGTKEFVKKNGEFTVNIALVHRGVPVIGVIYAPALNLLYFARSGYGSYKLEGRSSITDSVMNTLYMEKAYRLPLKRDNDTFTVITSQSHLSTETVIYLDELQEKHKELNLISIGSSLKFCLLAEGKADIYPRFSPTMEWDTAAGQVILKESGGSVKDILNNRDLIYNKIDLLNPWFIADRT